MAPDFIQLRVEISNELGLHLRAASRLVQLAQQYKSEVRVIYDDRAASAKSVLDLMALGAACGAQLEIQATGPDAKEVTALLCELIEKGFHEDEDGRDESTGP